MEPILSVCLITYNHVKYIEQAIEGVLMQQVDFSFELVIADDFSTDGTRELLLAYKKKYPELIKLILQKKNVGPAKNWMNLITFPQCKYIAYFEGDDYWTDPYKLQKQVDYLERYSSCVGCFSDTSVINESGIVLHDAILNIFKREVSIAEVGQFWMHTVSICFRIINFASLIEYKKIKK